MAFVTRRVIALGNRRLLRTLRHHAPTRTATSRIWTRAHEDNVKDESGYNPDFAFDLQVTTGLGPREPPRNPSPRTPKHETNLNEADKIERGLRSTGHNLWGFVVYRCTYSDDAAWETCIGRLRKEIEESMDFHNGHDMLEPERFQLTIFDDATLFDGASSHTIRQHFKAWSSRALHEEQGSPEEIKARRTGPAHNLSSARYKFCVQIDERSLLSINGPEGEDCLGDAFVNVIQRDWKPLGPEDREKYEDEDEEWEDEEYEPIEGCEDEDVGWMRVQLGEVMPNMYSWLDEGDWPVVYRRPPDRTWVSVKHHELGW